MKIIHTADWHLGQRFYEYDRTDEHRAFLEWLKRTITAEGINLLLIAGDVFDVANPSAEAQEMYYRFLAEVTTENPHLQIVIIAGNHDSASRLEAPSGIMRYLRIHVAGIVRKDESQRIDYDSLIYPVRDGSGETTAYCLAVPYLRAGDYPVCKEDGSYTAGVKMFYQELYKRAQELNTGGRPVIAMGHLHTSQAELSDSEKSIRGGLEVVSPDTFEEGIRYTALGHIHKAQRVGGKEHIRYSGSPIPMSFSEINYKHRVLLIEIDEETRIEDLFVPRTVDLIRIGTPDKPLNMEAIIGQIACLPEKETECGNAPYLEVNVLLEAPNPLVRNEILDRLREKNVRFARCEIHYPNRENSEQELPITIEEIEKITPMDMFRKAYAKKYEGEIPEEIEGLFRKACESLEEERESK